MNERVQLRQFFVYRLDNAVSTDLVECVFEIQFQQALARLEASNIRSCCMSNSFRGARYAKANLDWQKASRHLCCHNFACSLRNEPTHRDANCDRTDATFFLVEGLRAQRAAPLNTG